MCHISEQEWRAASRALLSFLLPPGCFPETDDVLAVRASASGWSLALAFSPSASTDFRPGRGRKDGSEGRCSPGPSGPEPG